MTRVFNFSAGPAALPEEVLQQAAAEMMDWHGTGQSVMEMSHRGPDFMAIHAEAQSDLRALLGIPDNYRTLFIQGGATLQFSMVPLNLLREHQSADYVHTGVWSDKAIKEAKRFGRVNVVATGEDSGYNHVPPEATWEHSADAAYLHICSNETIGGVQFHWTPQTDVPLVADMSSDILSRPIDVSRYGLIYAGAQKNIGPAGVTLVIVRDDLIGHVRAGMPTLLDYKVYADNDSMLNTPPTYGIYLAGLVFKWLKRQGGLTEIAKRNAEKAALLYEAIDASGFYRNPVEKSSRSLMNVPFTLANPDLDAAFLQGAAERGMTQLAGHRSVGGMRASIYNAMPRAGVEALVDYLKDFEREHG
ncbi:MAG: hypothetical protein RIR70_958 [Pseudomonadota bacterium]